MMIVFLQIIICILIADFLTGLIHWWEDTYGNPNWPIIGKMIIVPNLIHHYKPRAMLTTNTWHRCSGSIIISIVVALIFLALGIFTWQVGLTLLIASFGNEYHAWTHMNKKENHPIVNFLHKYRIITTPKHHGWHHHAPYDTYFCTITNILNPILERLNFWQWVELILDVEFNIKPLRCDPIRNGV